VRQLVGNADADLARNAHAGRGRRPIPKHSPDAPIDGDGASLHPHRGGRPALVHPALPSGSACTDSGQLHRQNYRFTLSATATTRPPPTYSGRTLTGSPARAYVETDRHRLRISMASLPPWAHCKSSSHARPGQAKPSPVVLRHAAFMHQAPGGRRHAWAGDRPDAHEVSASRGGRGSPARRDSGGIDAPAHH
jgi:hypothetical protein